MRVATVVLAILALALIPARSQAQRVLLVPLDSRPAAGQFAAMIGRMASVEVRLPPYETLGRFTQPGSPEAILDWLEKQDYRDVTAVVASTDMIAYGGLIASRVNDVPYDLAVQRLQRLARIRRANPKVRFLLFSAVMRLAPTATRSTAGWRLQLARYAEAKDRFQRTKSASARQTMKNLQGRIPAVELLRYDLTRERNLEVSREMIKMVARKQFDYLIFGQDDAQPFGPHVPETIRLRRLATNLYVTGSVYFAEGIDQQGNILLSRALLRANNWQPVIRVVYSDDDGRRRIATYESKPIEQSLRDQIISSGARLAVGDEPYDYTLYLNVPGRRPEPFNQFRESLIAEIDQGFPVSVADINIAKDGTSDPELFEALSQEGRMQRLLSFAGWNTAGNTMGTSIPAANIYLLARRLNRDPLTRELAQREFLLHRFVNDYAYHKFTRPRAYGLIDASATASREETYGEAFDSVDQFVRGDLELHLVDYWNSEFRGKRFFAGQREYELTELVDTRIFLPWPRAYEVRLEFRLRAEPVKP